MGKKAREANYYGVSLSDSIQLRLEAYFSTQPDLDSSLFKALVTKNRIPKHHHSTLIHSRNREGKEKEWDFYKSITKTQVTVELDKLVFDDKLMVLTVRKIEPETISSMNKYPHITVGTIDSSVKNFLSNSLLETVFDNDGEVEGVTILELDPVWIIEGVVRAFH